MRRDKRNCPFCLAPIGPEEEKVRCPKCGVAHHAECWKTNGSCSVYGCDGWVVWSALIGDAVTPIPAEQVEVDASQVGATREKPDNCIKCGSPVKKGTLICRDCRKRRKSYYLENCFGPALLTALGFVAVVSLIVRAAL